MLIASPDRKPAPPGSRVTCAECGHMMISGPGGTLRDLTTAEARATAAHPRFPAFLAKREEMLRHLWG
jgi:hypothetical protein